MTLLAFGIQPEGGAAKYVVLSMGLFGILAFAARLLLYWDRFWDEIFDAEDADESGWRSPRDMAMCILIFAVFGGAAVATADSTSFNVTIVVGVASMGIGTLILVAAKAWLDRRAGRRAVD